MTPLRRTVESTQPGPSAAAISERVRWMCRRVVGEDVLDAGCGSGQAAAALAAEGYRVMAVDQSQEAVDATRDRFAAAGLKLNERLAVVKAPVTDLPSEAATFDTALYGDVLTELVDPVPALREAARVLRPGGRLIVTCPYGESTPTARRVLLGELIEIVGMHFTVRDATLVEDSVALVAERTAPPELPDEALFRALAVAERRLAEIEATIADVDDQREQLRAALAEEGSRLREATKADLRQAKAELTEARSAANAELAQAREAAKAELDELRTAAEQEAGRSREAAEARLQEAQSQADARLQALQAETGTRIAEVQRQADAATEQVRSTAERELAAARAEAAERLQAMEAEREQLRAAAAEQREVIAGQRQLVSDLTDTAAEHVARIADLEARVVDAELRRQQVTDRLAAVRTEAEVALQRAQRDADAVLSERREAASEALSALLAAHDDALTSLSDTHEAATAALQTGMEREREAAAATAAAALAALTTAHDQAVAEHARKERDFEARLAERVARESELRDDLGRLDTRAERLFTQLEASRDHEQTLQEAAADSTRQFEQQAVLLHALQADHRTLSGALGDANRDLRSTREQLAAVTAAQADTRKQLQRATARLAGLEQSRSVRAIRKMWRVRRRLTPSRPAARQLKRPDGD